MNLILRGPLFSFGGNLIHDLQHTNCIFITEITVCVCVCVRACVCVCY